MSPQDRQKLRDAAIAAVNATRARSGVRHAALAADWQLQTSNSFRRIGAHGDGDVLCGTKHPVDGHPDLLAAPAVLDYVVAAQPRALIQLLDEVDVLEEKLARARVVCEKVVDIDARLDGIADVVTALGDAVTHLASSDPQAAFRARAIVDKLMGALAEVRR